MGYKTLKAFPRGKKCQFCLTSLTDPEKFGEIYQKSDVIIHYFCLLLASKVEQNGKDDAGILGFYARDIKKEAKRGSRIVCSYCKKKGATIHCGKEQCEIVFHFPCGLENGSSHHFKDSFKSFCKKHSKKQVIPAKLKTQVQECVICSHPIIFSTEKFIWPPCCKPKALLHKRCTQRLASSAGYYLKCPLCNNKTEFCSGLRTLSIFIPEREASWESEPHAFQELSETPKECEALACKCPQGRFHFTTRTKNKRWHIEPCVSCGSIGIHHGCMDQGAPGRIGIRPGTYECSTCLAVSQRIEDNTETERDVTLPEIGASPVNDDISASQDSSSSSESSDSENFKEFCKAKRKKREELSTKIIIISDSEDEVLFDKTQPIPHPINVRPPPRRHLKKRRPTISHGLASPHCSGAVYEIEESEDEEPEAEVSTVPQVPQILNVATITPEEHKKSSGIFGTIELHVNEDSYEFIEVLNLGEGEEPTYTPIRGGNELAYRSLQEADESTFTSTGGADEPTHTSIQEADEPTYTSIEAGEEATYTSIEVDEEPPYTSSRVCKEPSYTSVEVNEGQSYRSLDNSLMLSYTPAELRSHLEANNSNSFHDAGTVVSREYRGAYQEDLEVFTISDSESENPETNMQISNLIMSQLPLREHFSKLASVLAQAVPEQAPKPKAKRKKKNSHFSHKKKSTTSNEATPSLKRNYSNVNNPVASEYSGTISPNDARNASLISVEEPLKNTPRKQKSSTSPRKGRKDKKILKVHKSLFSFNPIGKANSPNELTGTTAGIDKTSSNKRRSMKVSAANSELLKSALTSETRTESVVSVKQSETQELEQEDFRANQNLEEKELLTPSNCSIQKEREAIPVGVDKTSSNKRRSMKASGAKSEGLRTALTTETRPNSVVSVKQSETQELEQKDFGSHQNLEEKELLTPNNNIKKKRKAIPVGINETSSNKRRNMKASATNSELLKTVLTTERRTESVVSVKQSETQELEEKDFRADQNQEEKELLTSSSSIQKEQITIPVSLCNSGTDKPLVMTASPLPPGDIQLHQEANIEEARLEEKKGNRQSDEPLGLHSAAVEADTGKGINRNKETTISKESNFTGKDSAILEDEVSLRRQTHSKKQLIIEESQVSDSNGFLVYDDVLANKNVNITLDSTDLAILETRKSTQHHEESFSHTNYRNKSTEINLKENKRRHSSENSLKNSISEGGDVITLGKVKNDRFSIKRKNMNPPLEVIPKKKKLAPPPMVKHRKRKEGDGGNGSCKKRKDKAVLAKVYYELL